MMKDGDSKKVVRNQFNHFKEMIPSLIILE
jgi:hypothetical protein